MYPLDDLSQPLRTFAEASFDSEIAVVITDARQQVQWLNRRFAELTAIEAEEAIGLHLTALRAPGRSPHTPQRLAMHTVAYPDPFGGEIELLSLTVPIFDDGTCVGYGHVEYVGSEVEEVRRLRSGLQSTESLLRESQHLYRELFANSADLIQSTDVGGRMLFVNDAWLHRLGYREFEVGELSIADVLAPGYDEESAIFRCEHPDAQHRVRCELRTKEGTHLWVEGSVSYRFVGERAVGTHAILRDVTEAMRLHELETEFISMVNHELRTPLTSIAGAIELLLSGVAGELSPKAVNYLELARRNTDRLHSIVGDMIEMERLSIDRLAIDETELDLEAIVRAAVEDNRGYATREDVALSWSADEGTLATDERRMQQLLANLISNAINHGRPREVHVSAVTARGVCRIAVADDGRGVPLGFRPQMFGRFFQAEPGGLGSGLGLSIVRALAEALGGEVGWCSVEGAGSVFWIDVPIDGESDHDTVHRVEAAAPRDTIWALAIDPASALDLGRVTSPPDELLTQLAASGWTLPLRVFGASEEVQLAYDEPFDWR